MDKSTRLANVTLLCIVNGFFTIAGILLNSVVILCFLKASHLRKKLCYFMIFVLTCFDLGVVSVCHPLTAITAYIWSTDEYDDHIIFRVRLYSNVLYYFSFLALLTMNIDRFLAIKHPLFHKKSVTKTKLKILLLLFLSAAVVERVLAFMGIFGLVCYATKAVFIGALLLVIFFINYQMFMTAKTARRGKEDGKSGVKNISTCMLAVACFVLFSSPLMVFCGFQFAPDTFSKENTMLFTLWANTIACTNSTINCFIFFWKDKSLSVEGMKILKKCFQLAKIYPKG